MKQWTKPIKWWNYLGPWHKPLEDITSHDDRDEEWEERSDTEAELALQQCVHRGTELMSTKIYRNFLN